MGDLIILPMPTTLDIPVARVTESAREACTRVLILGETADGTPYAAASFADRAEILWWLERFKLQLLTGDF